MALVDPIATINSAFPGAINPYVEIAEMFITAQLDSAPGERLSGFAFYGTYEHFCAIYELTPVSSSAFAVVIDRCFPGVEHAVRPTSLGPYWTMTGVKLANATTTRELLYLLTPLVAMPPTAISVAQ